MLIRLCSKLVVIIVLLILGACSNEQVATEVSQPHRVQPLPETGKHSVTNSLTTIIERKELRVGMQVGYPPFEMLGSNGNLIGFDVDAASMLATDLKVELRLVRLNWSELIPMLHEGKIDVIMSGMTITPERNKELMFTSPLLDTGRMFLVHAVNADKYKKFRDLNQSGVFIVSVPEGKGDLKISHQLPKASFREFPDKKSAVNEILEKRAQAYIDEEYTIRLLCAQNPSTLVSRFESLSFEPIAWGVRSGETHWLNFLNNFIIKISGDGRLDQLKKKWFHDYYLDIRAPFLK